LEATEESFDLDETLDLVRHLRDFLTLGIGEPTYVSECNIVLDDATNEMGQPVRATLFWSQLGGYEHRKALLPFDMFFTLSDLGDNVGKYVRNWYEHRHRLHRFFDLYFGALYNRGLYLENRFLAYAQALELYHRLTGV